MEKRHIGIDIGKETFVAAYPEKQDNYTTKIFKNTPMGVKTFIKSLHESDHCILEATGTYSLLLSYSLASQDLKLSVINPKQSSFFNKMLLNTYKTDKADAVLLARYGQKMDPKLFVMPSMQLQKLKQLRIVIRQLKKQQTAMSNVLESLLVIPAALQSQQALRATQECINGIQTQIEQIQTALYQVDDQEYQPLVSRLTSIKGIGNDIANAFIVNTNGFKDFEQAKQLAKYIGICPTYYESGSSIKIKGSINRGGLPELRHLLYLAAWSASRYNKACKELYARLIAKGKSGKLAMIAVAHKLLRQMFAVVKQDCLFDNDFELKLIQSQ